MRKYQIAVMLESGKFDVIENYEARNDIAAEKYAEKNHPKLDWYVLDSDGDNINA